MWIVCISSVLGNVAISWQVGVKHLRTSALSAWCGAAQGEQLSATYNHSYIDETNTPGTSS